MVEEMTLETNDQPLNANELFYKKFKNLKQLDLGKMSTRAAQFPETTCRRDYTLYRGAYYL
jgi:hypothetical protein